MSQALANIPWWVAAVVMLAGAVVMVHGNRRGQAGVRSWGLVGISLGILLLALPFLIDTDAERMRRRTQQIISDVSRQDWPGLKSMLDNQTRVDFAGQRTNVRGAEAIRASTEAAAEQVGLKSVVMYSVKIEQEEGLIMVTFSAASTQEGTQDRPYPSSWEFDWRQRGNDWYLDEIRLLSLGSQLLQS